VAVAQILAARQVVFGREHSKADVPQHVGAHSARATRKRVAGALSGLASILGGCGSEARRGALARGGSTELPSVHARLSRLQCMRG